MFYTVYKITNKINGKIYIGKHQTKELNDDYMGSGKHLCRAIDKHGIENFEKEILFQFDNEVEMNLKEAELVTDEFCLRKDTYNICPGGKGGWGYVNNSVWSEEKRLQHNQKYSPFKNFTEEKRSELGFNLNIKRKEMIKSGELVPHTPWNKNKKYEIEKLKGHKLQEGAKNSQYGVKRTWIVKDGIRKKVLSEEVQKYLNDGWVKGYKHKIVVDIP